MCLSAYLRLDNSECWKTGSVCKTTFKSLTNTLLGLSLGSLWLWDGYTETSCLSAGIQRDQAWVVCIALLLSSQAELCLCQLTSLVSPCQAGLCTALGTMPCEKSGQSYPTCVGKGKRAVLWEQAMPYQLASVMKNGPCPDLFTSLNKLKDRFHSKCMKHFVFSKSSILTVLFSSALLATGHHSPLSCLSSSFHQAHHLLTDYVSGCWISLEITQCCFIKERKSICTLNEFSCHHLSALCSEVSLR